MPFEYKPGQIIRLKGKWGGYAATVIKVTDFMLTILFEDLKETTLIIMEHVREMENNGEIELVSRS